MSGFPLLLIPLAICNIIVFLMPGVAFDTRLFALIMPSGSLWTVTLHDALISLGLLLLMLEMLRSARAGGKYITDHLLALVIFGGAAAEFVLLPQFANATFFLLTLIALVDFLSGLGLRRRPRRVVEAVVAEPAVRTEAIRAEPVRVEPIYPAPPPAAPASVIVPPPPPPAPPTLAAPGSHVDSPPPGASAHSEPAQTPPAPGIDVTPNGPHERPVRPSVS